MTVPTRTEVVFAQGGKEIRCRPGGFFLERSHEPYEFSHTELAEMWVIKIDAKALGGRIRASRIIFSPADAVTRVPSML